jgi:lipopolysaccharide/colanic/teichoic acid biosynthesis glycosyltransferase
MKKFWKHIFDICISVLAIMLLLPVFAVISIAIRISSKGPAIFKQERAGKDGKPFTFYKFRTMKLDVDPFGPSPKSGEDPRLTKVGIFLREYSLDELPQLFNILKGDMSIVGPRPLYISQMGEWNEQQKKRLLVKPGLTGLAQVSGRGELTREEKLELDVKYVETTSFTADIKIILVTIAQVFGRKRIYEKRYSRTQYTRGEKESKKGS